MKKLPVLAGVCLLASVASADAALLYQTTPLDTSIRFSDTDSGFRTFDAFALAQSANVERVTWSGAWLDLGAPQPAAAPLPDLTGWEIAFYSNAAGQPGALLSSQTLSAAAVTATGPTTVVWGFGQLGLFNASYYTYTVDLPTPVGLAGGTPFWLSVQALGGTSGPHFGWYAGTGGDGTSWQTSPGTPGTVGGDRHFRLDGSVPEPATLILFGVAGVLVAMRRRSPQR